MTNTEWYRGGHVGKSGDRFFSTRLRLPTLKHGIVLDELVASL